MTRLSLHLLGPFQATLNGAPVNGFASNKVRALLTYLALEADRPHSREVLAGMLWPEQPQRLAMDNLRYALADLRRNIKDATARPPFLIVNRDTLQFDRSSDTWLDVADFERLAASQDATTRALSIPDLVAAARLYRGGFLEGFSLRDSFPFEEWMLNRREQLERTMVAVLSTLADDCEQRGELQLAMHYAWQQAALEPWQEEVHRQLMRLLAFDGQRSAALLQYETCQKSLASELGVKPSPQTTRLYESIRDETLYIPVHFAGLSLPTQAEPDAAPLSRFVARDAELQQLNRRLEQALRGQGQVFFITGEAGSGKTTLVKEFLSRSLQSQPGLVAAYGNCNAFAGSADPYLPIIEILRVLSGDIEAQRAAGSLDRNQALHLWAALPTVVQALVEVGSGLINRFIPGEELLARTRVLAHVQTARLEELVGRSVGRRFESEPGSGRVQQSELFEQVAGVLKVVARTHPLVLMLDDLQWADHDTINLLFYLCRRLAGSRLLLIGIYRLEDLVPAWDGKPHPLVPALHELQTAYGNVQLDLSHSDGHEFVAALLDCEPNALSEDFRARLEQHTGGIPLFTVELWRGLQEWGDVVRDLEGRWIETRELDWERLPPRVEAAIAEQVGRLSLDWQSLLALASVEGDEFSAEVLADVLQCRLEALVQQLSGPLSKQHRIVLAAGLKRAGPAGASLSRYRFRHHLFQSYFYWRQDVVERARRHEAIGSALEKLYGDQAEEIAVLLARHFETANLPQKAAAYLLQAGQKAVHLSAYEEAILHVKHGLSLLLALPDTQERNRLELQLQLALAAPLIATQGYTSPDLESAYRRARQLAEQTSSGKDLSQILSILKSYHNLRGNPVQSREIAGRLLQIAEQSGHTGLLMTANSRMVSNSLYYGQWADMRRHLDETIRNYDREKNRALVYELGADSMGVALEAAALGFWIMGYPDQARRHSRDALAQAGEIAHPMGSWFAYYYATFFHIYAREVEAAEQWIQAALGVCDEQNLVHYRRYTECFHGWVRAQQGDREGLTTLEAGIAWLKDIGDRMNLYSYLWLLAEACYRHEEYSRALGIVAEAQALSRETEMIFLLPELHRLQGELLLYDSSRDRAMRDAEALQCFSLAIEVAQGQQSRMWELRAVTSLSRLLQRQGQAVEARRRLMEIYSWFTEGFETTDLKDARSVLDELADKPM